MRKFEEYITNSFKYVLSDIKKGLVGGLLSSISGIIGAVFGIILSMLSIHYINPELAFEIPYNTLSSSLTLSSLLVIGCFGFLIALIIGFIVDGYYVRVMKTTVENYDILPDWNNVADLLKRGFLYWIGVVILLIIFMIVPILFFIIGIFLMIKNPIVGFAFVGIGLILLFILIIAFLIYIGLAEVNYSVKGFIGFFEFKEIFSMINLTYIVLLIVVGIITIVIGFIVQLPFILIKYLVGGLNPASSSQLIIEIISTVVSTFVGFYMVVFSRRAVALYYKDRVEELKNRN